MIRLSVSLRRVGVDEREVAYGGLEKFGFAAREIKGFEKQVNLRAGIGGWGLSDVGVSATLGDSGTNARAQPLHVEVGFLKEAPLLSQVRFYGFARWQRNRNQNMVCVHEEPHLKARIGKDH